MQVALVVLDGWGLGAGAPSEFRTGPSPEGGRDAVAAADTPTFDRYAREGATATLDAAGRSVGLPDGQMGNSEVGHLTIGAGAVVERAYTRIEDAIDDGTLADRPAVAGALAAARGGRPTESEAPGEDGGRLHLVGLASDGGVHSHVRHLRALARAAGERGVEPVVHAITDGRDTPPESARRYVEPLAAAAEATGGTVATVSGRYYAMDRDGNWERTRRAYDAVVDRRADHHAETAAAAVAAGYDRGETDEFLAPTTVEGGPPVGAGDAVLFVNFRADRMRQLVRSVAGLGPGETAPDEWRAVFGDQDPPPVHVATMTEYDREFSLPVAFETIEPGTTLGEALAEAGRTQLRIAESEKYPHVTYFLNGGRELAYDGEIRRIVDSPDVPTYDRAPAMSAAGVTDEAVAVVDAHDPDVVVCNYANPDMVGHTGDFEATVVAVEAVDRELGRLVEAVHAAGAYALVTADHGNADDLGTVEAPHTAHTTNPVPFVALPPAEDGVDARDGTLADLAPTVLALLGDSVPESMTGRSLLE
jgi:2,3-bisphosphoglycerate-independent phosphoglycerate mutase